MDCYCDTYYVGFGHAGESLYAGNEWMEEKAVHGARGGAGSGAGNDAKDGTDEAGSKAGGSGATIGACQLIIIGC